MRFPNESGDTVAVRQVILSESETSCQEESGGIAIATPPPGAASQRRQALKGDAAARMASLAEFLAPDDRALMRWVYADGKSAREISVLLGEPARSVQRRITRLERRCRSAPYTLIVERSGTWDDRLRAVSRLCILEGRSMRHAAKALGLPTHAVCVCRAAVLAMARARASTART